MTSYEDFSSKKMKLLKRDVERQLDNNEEVTSYRLAHNVLDPEDYPWSKKSLEKALTALRQKWEKEEKIKITTEDTGITEKKMWVKTDSFEIEDD